jgi:hypothetical protein
VTPRDHHFGRYDVVPDGTPGLAPGSNQVTETEFARLEQAWRNIQSNVGMTVTARHPGERAAFMHMLVRGMEHSHEFREQITRIGLDTNPAHNVPVVLRSSASGRDAIGDNFRTHRVDLEDLRRLPEQSTNPSDTGGHQLFRAEAILHFLTERASHHRDFDDAHPVGIEHQNAWRAERGFVPVDDMRFPERDDGREGRPPHNLLVEFHDGTREVISLANTDIGVQLSPPGDPFHSLTPSPTHSRPDAPYSYDQLGRVVPPERAPEHPVPVELEHSIGRQTPKLEPSAADTSKVEHTSSLTTATSATDQSQIEHLRADSAALGAKDRESAISDVHNHRDVALDPATASKHDDLAQTSSIEHRTHADSIGADHDVARTDLHPDRAHSDAGPAVADHSSAAVVDHASAATTSPSHDAASAATSPTLTPEHTYAAAASTLHNDLHSNEASRGTDYANDAAAASTSTAPRHEDDPANFVQHDHGQ